MASGVVRLAVLDFDLTIADAGPLKPEALFRAQPAINQDRGHIVKQGRGVRKVDSLFGIRQHAFSMGFAGNHPNARQRLFYLAPFDCQ